MSSELKIRTGSARAYTIPTDLPEADGTFFWENTTLILVTLDAGEEQGIGYTYSSKVAAPLAQELIKQAVEGEDPMDVPLIFSKMRYFQRNYGREGIAATALSAIDIALWDLKAKLLKQPLAKLLGMMRDSAPVYGSGGFTSYSDAQLRNQLRGWVDAGISRVKMKVGTDPSRDLARAHVARDAIGPETQLFVDANGAYSQTQAAEFAKRYYNEFQVVWFEEPVSSDDLAGLRFVRDRAPAGIDIAAGEYGWSAMTLKRMLAAEAVDVLQADATRCGGITGFMDVAALADAQPIPLSAHCGPSIHMHLACAARPLRHVEYFHDHVRIESMLFDGFCGARKGAMYPDLTRAGLGLEFKTKDAERFKEND
jgi:L-alanine-DL-glutamate epimerase-like enolase superfamily enzyme